MNLGELIEKLQELELRHGDRIPVYFSGIAPESETADEVDFDIKDARIVNSQHEQTHVLLTE